MFVVLEAEEQVHSLKAYQNDDDDVEGKSIDERTDEAQKPSRAHDECELHKQRHVRLVATAFEVKGSRTFGGVPDLHDDVDVEADV